MGEKTQRKFKSKSKATHLMLHENCSLGLGLEKNLFYLYIKFQAIRRTVRALAANLEWNR